MDVVHEASAKVSTSEPYSCAACAYAGSGFAVALAHASRRQGGVLFGDDLAGDTAEAHAWSEAMSDVAMAPCPRCGAVDRSAWRAWMSKLPFLGTLVIGMLASLAGAMLCAAIFSAANLLSTVCAATLGPGMLVGGVLYWLLPLRRKRARTRQVRFEPPR